MTAETAIPDVGDVAPDFELAGSSGETVKLSDLRGEKRSLLIFYPKDFTGGWSNQLAAVRDAIADFREADTEPYGVNFADADSHLRFRSSLNLPYDLLVDEDLAVSRAYGVLKPDPDNRGEYLASINRTVVIVGKDGTIIYRRAGAPPVEELLDAILKADDEQFTPA